MRFEWDDAKARSNLIKHGVAFDVAIKVFDDPFAISGHDRTVVGKSDGEPSDESASPPCFSSDTHGSMKMAKSMYA